MNFECGWPIATADYGHENWIQNSNGIYNSHRSCVKYFLFGFVLYMQLFVCMLRYCCCCCFLFRMLLLLLLLLLLLPKLLYCMLCILFIYQIMEIYFMDSYCPYMSFINRILLFWLYVGLDDLYTMACFFQLL